MTENLETRYTLKEISKDLNIKVKTLRSYISQGILIANKVGRTYLVRASDLDKFLENNAVLSKDKDDPVKIPSRNYLCRYYDGCLTEAALENKTFSCDGCQSFRLADKQEITEAELGGMLCLWKSVFGMSVSI